MRLSFLMSEIRTGLRSSLTMTIAVVVTVAVSLAFFGAALLLGRQIALMKGYWYDKVQVSVFLCPAGSEEPTCAGGEAGPAQKQMVEERLNGLPQVDRIFFENKEEAFRHYREQYDVVDPVIAEAMQESFRVSLTRPQEAAAVATAVAGMPGVESVDDQRRLLGRVFGVLDGLRRLALALALAQVVAVMLLIINTVRVAAYSRRQETTVMRLVGASDLAIRLPFVLQSAFAAFVGAAFAAVLLVGVHVFFIAGRVPSSYRVIGAGDLWATLPWLFVVGVGLAALASYVTLRRYLRV